MQRLSGSENEQINQNLKGVIIFPYLISECLFAFWQSKLLSLNLLCFFFFGVT